MTNERDLAIVDEVIAELETLLAKLKQRRNEQEAKSADQG